MGLQRLFNLRKSRSEPPDSSSGAPARIAAVGESSTRKLIGTQKFLPSKQMQSAETPRSPSFATIQRSGSNPSPAFTHQVRDLEDVFKKFDANGDGKISWLELGSIMSSLGYNASEQELRDMVREADCDGDGFIDLQEFIELNTKGIDSAGVIQVLRDAFKIFDLDKNGSISSEELHKVLRSLGENSTIEDCQNMIKGVDCDGDGLVSFEEFKIMMNSS